VAVLPQGRALHGEGGRGTGLAGGVGLEGMFLRASILAPVRESNSEKCSVRIAKK
jgi:hypothetical protein